MFYGVLFFNGFGGVFLLLNCFGCVFLRLNDFGDVFREILLELLVQ